MTRSELIEVIAQKYPQLSIEEISQVVRFMITQMAVALAVGDRIEVRGFGAFSLHTHPAKLGRNPKTGEKVKIAAKVRVHFKPGLELRNRVKLSSISVDK